MLKADPNAGRRWTYGAAIFDMLRLRLLTRGRGRTRWRLAAQRQALAAAGPQIANLVDPIAVGLRAGALQAKLDVPAVRRAKLSA